MSDDPWSALSASWHEVAPRDPPPAPEHIRRQVLAADRSFLLRAVGEVGVYLLGIAWIIWYLVTHEGPAAFMLGFMMMWFLGWALDFAFAIRRGVWRAADDSTGAWLALLAERCARRQRYVRTGWLMLHVMTFAFAAYAFVIWLWFPEDNARLQPRWWLLALWFAGAYALQWWWARGALASAAEQERRIAGWRKELEAPLG